MHNLVIDIGNSYSKVAVFEGRELRSFDCTKQVEISYLENLIVAHQIENATVSSVGVETNEISSFLKRRLNYIQFSTAIAGGIQSSYESKHTLGLDRWAKVIAAHTLFPQQNCLLIDAGTCITYDVLTETSEYNGGSISLGIQMRFDALNRYTGRLPLVDFDENEQQIPLGNNTVNAIKNGVLQGLINEIEGFIALENKKNNKLKVILTGGNADFLSKQLKNSIFASQIIIEPYLVLRGLNEVITL